MIDSAKITTLLRNFYLKMSKFKIEFHPSFTVGWVYNPPPPPPPPADLRSDTIYIWTTYPKINRTGNAGPQALFLPGTYYIWLHFSQLFLVRSNNAKHFPSIISIYMIAILHLYVNRLSFHCTVCEIVVGDHPSTINLNNSTHIAVRAMSLTTSLL